MQTLHYGKYKLQIDTMSVQFLPNYFKKVGILLFIVAGIPAMKKGFIEGRNAADGIPAPESFEVFSLFGYIITEPIYNLFSLLGVAGLLIYFFSKEKLMDEYLVRLRLESVQLTFILTAIFLFVWLFFDHNRSISAVGLIEYQVVIFLVINKAKKLYNLPASE